MKWTFGTQPFNRSSEEEKKGLLDSSSKSSNGKNVPITSHFGSDPLVSNGGDDDEIPALFTSAYPEKKKQSKVTFGFTKKSEKSSSGEEPLLTNAKTNKTNGSKSAPITQPITQSSSTSTSITVRSAPLPKMQEEKHRKKEIELSDIEGTPLEIEIIDTVLDKLFYNTFPRFEGMDIKQAVWDASAKNRDGMMKYVYAGIKGANGLWKDKKQEVEATPYPEGKINVVKGGNNKTHPIGKSFNKGLSIAKSLGHDVEPYDPNELTTVLLHSEKEKVKLQYPANYVSTFRDKKVFVMPSPLESAREEYFLQFLHELEGDLTLCIGRDVVSELILQLCEKCEKNAWSRLYDGTFIKLGLTADNKENFHYLKQAEGRGSREESCIKAKELFFSEKSQKEYNKNKGTLSKSAFSPDRKKSKKSRNLKENDTAREVMKQSAVVAVTTCQVNIITNKNIQKQYNLRIASMLNYEDFKEYEEDKLEPLVKVLKHLKQQYPNDYMGFVCHGGKNRSQAMAAVNNMMDMLDDLWKEYNEQVSKFYPDTPPLQRWANFRNEWDEPNRLRRFVLANMVKVNIDATGCNWTQVGNLGKAVKYAILGEMEKDIKRQYQEEIGRARPPQTPAKTSGFFGTIKGIFNSSAAKLGLSSSKDDLLQKTPSKGTVKGGFTPLGGQEKKSPNVFSSSFWGSTIKSSSKNNLFDLADIDPNNKKQPNRKLFDSSDEEQSLSSEKESQAVQLGIEVSTKKGKKPEQTQPQPEGKWERVASSKHESRKEDNRKDFLSKNGHNLPNKTTIAPNPKPSSVKTPVKSLVKSPEKNGVKPTNPLSLTSTHSNPPTKNPTSQNWKRTAPSQKSNVQNIINQFENGNGNGSKTPEKQSLLPKGNDQKTKSSTFRFF